MNWSHFVTCCLFSVACLQLTTAQSLAEEIQPADYQERLERSWEKVKEEALNNAISPEERIAALNRFLWNYPQNNRHNVYAEKLIKALEIGDVKINNGSLGPLYDPIRRTEWFTLQAGIGRFGVCGKLGLFTLRWRHFYWNIVQFMPAIGWEIASVRFGTELGTPIHIGSSGKAEIRLGVAFEFGTTDIWSEPHDYPNDGTAMLFVPAPTIKFIHRIKNTRFKYIIGIDFPFYLKVESWEFRDYGDDWEEIEKTEPVIVDVVAFFGFSI